MNCVYKNVCGGESCARCKGRTTKTDVKKALKNAREEVKRGIDTNVNINLISRYNSILKGV